MWRGSESLTGADKLLDFDLLRDHRSQSLLHRSTLLTQRFVPVQQIFRINVETDSVLVSRSGHLLIGINAFLSRLKRTGDHLVVLIAVNYHPAFFAEVSRACYSEVVSGELLGVLCCHFWMFSEV